MPFRSKAAILALAGALAALSGQAQTYHAKIALATMGHERASREILHDLESSRRERRSAAIVAAGRARLRQARPKLLAMSDGDTDQELMRDALARLS